MLILMDQRFLKYDLHSVNWSLANLSNCTTNPVPICLTNCLQREKPHPTLGLVVIMTLTA